MIFSMRERSFLILMKSVMPLPTWSKFFGFAFFLVKPLHIVLEHIGDQFSQGEVVFFGDRLEGFFQGGGNTGGDRLARFGRCHFGRMAEGGGHGKKDSRFPGSCRILLL